MRTLEILVSFLILSAIGSAQTTWHVPGDFAAIQDALDDASVLEGDTIVVGPGTYYENIKFGGKDVTLESSNGAEATVIDGSGLHAVVEFDPSNGAGTVLDGFTITNGYGSNPYAGHGGAGIICWDGCSPTIKNSIITKNVAIGSGGALVADRSCNVTIKQTVFSENTCLGRGGAISCGDFYCVLNIRGCIFKKNVAGTTGGGIAMSKYSTMNIRDSLILDNEAATAGGGIAATQCTLVSRNTVIARNSLTDPAGQGGGVYVHIMYEATLINNTITDNEGADGGGIYNYQGIPVIAESIIWGNTGTQISYYDQPDVTFCDVEGGFPGKGNFDADPLFVAGCNSCYCLSQTASGQYLNSPCIDAGSGSAASFGVDDCWTRTDGTHDSGAVDLGYHSNYWTNEWYVPLWTDAYYLHDDIGGTVNFWLRAPAEYEGRYYLLLASLSGTEPGFPLPGGFCVLPLNWDTLSHITMTYLNSPMFSDFLGTIGQAGKANAQLNLPPVPGLAWNTMYFAYCCNNPFNYVSNPVTVDIVD